MRWSAVLLALTLAGCGVPWTAPAGAFVALNAAAIPVIHRDVFDAVWSTITGRDCSIVRLDRNQTYCRPVEPPPEPPPYCTRSLGTVDCWRDPADLPRPIPPEVADGPRTLTPAQEADRTRRWPPL
jgi:hypothetical protein